MFGEAESRLTADVLSSDISTDAVLQSSLDNDAVSAAISTPSPSASVHPSASACKCSTRVATDQSEVEEGDDNSQNPPSLAPAGFQANTLHAPRSTSALRRAIQERSTSPDDDKYFFESLEMKEERMTSLEDTLRAFIRLTRRLSDCKQTANELYASLGDYNELCQMVRSMPGVQIGNIEEFLIGRIKDGDEETFRKTFGTIREWLLQVEGPNVDELITRLGTQPPDQSSLCQTGSGTEDEVPSQLICPLTTPLHSTHLTQQAESSSTFPESTQASSKKVSDGPGSGTANLWTQFRNLVAASSLTGLTRRDRQILSAFRDQADGGESQFLIAITELHDSLIKVEKSSKALTSFQDLLIKSQEIDTNRMSTQWIA